jgi:hypothetical protein
MKEQAKNIYTYNGWSGIDMHVTFKDDDARYRIRAITLDEDDTWVGYKGRMLLQRDENQMELIDMLSNMAKDGFNVEFLAMSEEGKEGKMKFENCALCLDDETFKLSDEFLEWGGDDDHAYVFADYLVLKSAEWKA